MPPFLGSESFAFAVGLLLRRGLVFETYADADADADAEADAATTAATAAAAAAAAASESMPI